ncbi:uncharacterized protein KY384_003252 [Bacidia gigantensis]|uniref:uncharacterized protein n=1 Tax=Bacidia gigantensis TaxID=2732470 RepID=UPI001D05BBFF|nr:uncharacterized protein KY384_003252 [Bacidia gigantensis]KAG8531621.1 hypothetical protein KY384_003252 [Bacidia gigantensis]
MADRPLFRRCKNTVESIQISEEQALADTTLRPQMTNLGSITGMELPTVLYTFRRGNGQALDNSKQKGSIASTKGAPLYNHYRRTYQSHRNLRRRHKKVLLTEVKERYKKEQPVIDIQRQSKGSPVLEQEALQTAEYVFAEKVYAIDALFTFATSSTEEECQRRVTAINALIALCKKQESQGFCRRRADIMVKEEQTLVSPPPSLSETLPVKCKATQCIFCLENKGLPDAKRLKTFAARGDLKKHFHRKHLRHHPDGQLIACDRQH